MSNEVGKLYISFDADGKPYINGLQELDRKTKAFSRDQQTAFDKLGSKLGSAIKTGMAVGASAVVAGGVLITKSLVKTAAAYEYEMSRIKAVTSATEAEMKAMSDLALKLGADTQFSAGEAAQGINELAKAGVSIAEIMGGGIQGTLALAASGELEVAWAAEIASNAMNVFSLSGEQVMTVADVLSSAAAASSLEVEDLAMSLQYIGPVASQIKIPMETVVGALAELAQMGIKGDMAGTGLRGMLNSLISPSSTAAEAMADLNVEMADAEGNIKPLPEILDDFADGLDGMTQQQKLDKLGRIFDTQQLGVAMQLIEGGSESLGEWTEAVSEKGEAERVATAKMDNFQGSVEQLRGSLETLLIRGGSPLIEWLRDGVDWLTEATNWAENFLTGLEDLEGWEGADLTGKIRIAWGDLERQFKEWFDGTGNAEYDIHAVIGGVSGEQKLSQMFESAGAAAGQFLLGVIGKEADAGDSVWMRAGKAIWGGFWEGLDSYLAEGVKGFFEADTVGEGIESTGSLWEANPVASLLGERGVFQQLGARIGAWIVEGLTGPESTGDMEDGGEAAGDAMGGAMVVPLTTRITSAILDALGVDTTGASRATGAEAGAAFESGFLSALSDINTLIQEKFDIKASAYAKGKATAGGLGLELGSGMGDTGGMKPQTVAMLGRLGALFPINMVSGYRANDQFRDHPSGTAFDITWPGMGEGMGDAIARAAIAMGARYAIWDRETWWPGGGRTPYSYSSQDPHRDHIHIRTYDQGGVLEPGYTMAANWTGVPEVIVPASLTADIDALIDAIRVLVNADTDIAEGLKGQERDAQVIAAFADRMGLSGSYTSREQARYGMMESQGADDASLAAQLGVVLGTLVDSVAEAQAQLDAAKSLGLPQEEINGLAADLFDLRSEVADTEAELADLTDTTEAAAQALRDTADAFGTAISQTGTLMDILGNASNGRARQDALSPYLMGLYGGSYNANLALMNSATGQSDILGYGSAALGDISSMFGTEQGAVERALDGTLDSISDSQELWEDAWQARADAAESSIDATIAALERQQTRMREAHKAELDELTSYYDEQLAALTQSNDDLSREKARAAAREGITSLEAELRSLYGQGGLSGSDLSRIQSLRTQITKAKKSAAEQEAAWLLEDRRTELERQRDAAVATLTEQQKNEEASLARRLTTAQESAKIQRDALEAERKTQLDAYDRQRRDAEKAAQDSIDLLVNKYAAMAQAVMNGEATLLGLTMFGLPETAGGITAASVGAATGASGVTLGGGVGKAPTGGSGFSGQSLWEDMLAADNMAKYGNPYGRYYGTEFWHDSAKPTQAERWSTEGTGSMPVEVKVAVSGDGTTLTDAQVQQLSRGVTEGVIAEIGRRQKNAAYFN
jgi:TP901 family phage tail tape measure protein